MMYLLLYSYLNIVYFGFITSHKIFSCISKYCSSCIQRFFSKMKLMKISLLTQLKQTNLENWLQISTDSPKDFNDPVFQHFVDELKHCNSDMRMDLQLLVPVLVLYQKCLYSTYLFGCYNIFYRDIFFTTCFALFLFLVSSQYFSPLLLDLLVIFNENLSQ